MEFLVFNWSNGGSMVLESRMKLYVTQPDFFLKNWLKWIKIGFLEYIGKFGHYFFFKCGL